MKLILDKAAAFGIKKETAIRVSLVLFTAYDYVVLQCHFLVINISALYFQPQLVTLLQMPHCPVM